VPALSSIAAAPGARYQRLAISALMFALSFHAFIVHLAANIVLEHPRFPQALVASVINAGAAIAFELIRFRRRSRWRSFCSAFSPD
jgi:hypothetical protein